MKPFFTSIATRLRFGIMAGGLAFLLSCDGGGSSVSGNVKIVVCFGDSITAGVGDAQSYPDILKGFLEDEGITVVNAGVSGEQLSTGVSRIASVIDQFNPTHILILEGVNDLILAGTDPVNVSNSLVQMLDIVIGKGVKPIVGTLTPTTGEPDYNPQIDAYNQQLKLVAQAKGVRVADLSREFGSGKGLLQDGLHPNTKGNRIIAITFAEAL
jgi:lysophospholipase L1-like esterase